MCGVVGIVSQEPVNQALYNALTVMQHRGQDAAGIVTWSDEHGLKQRKSNGLVRDVFRSRHMQRLKGNVGIGHVRYPTAGGSRSSEAQPFYVNSPYGICLAHNGNLTNHDELAELLIRYSMRSTRCTSVARAVMPSLHSLLAMVSSPFETRTVFDRWCWASRNAEARRTSWSLPRAWPLIFCSSRAFVTLVLASASSSRMMALFYPGEVSHTPCIFEYVYFARPDSILDNLSVYKARLRMGEQLAGKIVRDFPEHDIDVVIPIPDTSRTSALQVAYHLGVKYREGFIKNRYIGRTFIMPGQEERRKSVRRKLNAIDLEFRNKNVLLVDDSIVRGTTSKQIIKLAREAGARKVYFASAAPPVRYPNVYGIDMPAAAELIANGRTTDEIQEIIGADRLIYQDLHGLIRSVRHGNSDITEFDTSCFSGEYVTGDVTDEYLHELEERRNDAAKKKRKTKHDPESNVVAL